MVLVVILQLIFTPMTLQIVVSMINEYKERGSLIDNSCEEYQEWLRKH